MKSCELALHILASLSALGFTANPILSLKIWAYLCGMERLNCLPSLLRENIPNRASSSAMPSLSSLEDEEALITSLSTETEFSSPVSNALVSMQLMQFSGKSFMEGILSPVLKEEPATGTTLLSFLTTKEWESVAVIFLPERVLILIRDSGASCLLTAAILFHSIFSDCVMLGTYISSVDMS